MAARQMTINVGRCEHQRREPVLSEGGERIAIRCVGCASILAHCGTCDGCGLILAELYCLVPGRKRGHRFCNTMCFDKFKTAARQRAAKERRG